MMNILGMTSAKRYNRCASSFLLQLWREWVVLSRTHQIRRGAPQTKYSANGSLDRVPTPNIHWDSARILAKHHSAERRQRRDFSVSPHDTSAPAHLCERDQRSCPKYLR